MPIFPRAFEEFPPKRPYFQLHTFNMSGTLPIIVYLSDN
jgi:hypothetical protein